MSGREVDVVVVGARVAGAATALLLARAGLTVVLLERDRPGTDTLSTHALMRGGVLQLARWGLLERIIAAGTPAVRETTFHYSDGDVTVPIKPGAGVDALYAPRRTVLDPTLVAAAAAAGADVRFATSVVGLRSDHERVTGVEVRHRHGGGGPLRARLVVGADGRRSAVARLAGAPVTRVATATSAFTYTYVRGLEACGYEWAYRPGATGGFVPTNDGLTCVFAGARPERIGRGGPAVLRSVLAEASPAMAARFEDARPAAPVRTFTGQAGYLRRPWGPGWALVGDAGSWKDPISAHGLTDALRDAELLARAAVRALQDGDPAAYRDYEVVRDRLTLPLLHDSDEVAAMDWDDVRIVELLRSLNAAMNEELLVIAGFDREPATVDC